MLLPCVSVVHICPSPSHPNVHITRSIFPEPRAKPSQKMPNTKTNAPPTVESITKESRKKDRKNNQTELARSLNASCTMRKSKARCPKQRKSITSWHSFGFGYPEIHQPAQAYIYISPSLPSRLQYGVSLAASTRTVSYRPNLQNPCPIPCSNLREQHVTSSFLSTNYSASSGCSRPHPSLELLDSRTQHRGRSLPPMSLQIGIRLYFISRVDK